MKTLIQIIVLSAIIISTISCQTEGCTDSNASNFESKATSDDGSCIYKGDAVFWVDSTFHFNDITIVIDTQLIGIIDGYFNSKPDCGVPQAVNIELEAGIYEFTATDTLGATYNDTILIKKNRCNSKKIIIDLLR